MQNLKEQRARQSAQKIPAYIGGIAAWSIFIILLVCAIEVVKFVIFIFTHSAQEIGSALGELAVMLVFAATPIAMTYHFIQFVDTRYFQEFFVHSLLFRGFEFRKTDIFLELEQKKIRDIHRETSNEPFPELESKKNFLFVNQDTLKQELSQLKSQPIRSRHFHEEMLRLKNGETVDISESWKMNTMRKSSHELYAQVSDVYIDASKKSLSFRLAFPEFTEEHLKNKQLEYRLKQNLYDFLQAMCSEEWLKPYRRFYHTIVFTCHGTQVGDFGTLHPHPFMKIEIAVSEIMKREGQFFDAGQLQTISKVEFNNGSSIPI